MRVPFVHCGSNVGWMASGTSRSWAAANTGSLSGWPSGRPVVVERRDVAALGALADGPLELLGRGGRVAQRQVGGRHEARLVGAELADPAVVRLRVRLGQRRVLHLGLPQQADGRVQDGGVDVLGVEDVDALLRVHRAVRRLAEVRARRVLLHRRRGRARPSRRASTGSRGGSSSSAGRRSPAPRGRSRRAGSAAPGRGTAGRCSPPTASGGSRMWPSASTAPSLGERRGSRGSASGRRW